MTAAVNMEMAMGQTAFNQGLPLAMQQGRITLAQLDEAVRPILEMKFQLDVFEHPYADEERAMHVQSAPEHRNESLLAGLRNRLGCSASISYAPGSQLRRTIPSKFDAIFHTPKQLDWTPAQARQKFDKAVDVAANSDLAIMVLGEAQNMSGESASRDSLDVPGNQSSYSKPLWQRASPWCLCS